MPVSLADLNGNPYLGVFCRLIGGDLLCPLDTPQEFVGAVVDTLKVRPIKATLGNTNLHGSLIAGNSQFAIIPYFFDREEFERTLSENEEGPDLRVLLSDDPHTAWGNNLLLSEKAGLYNPDLSVSTVRELRRELDIELVEGTIAGTKTVGSVAVLNGSGIVVHPKATPEEMERIGELFGLRPQISTANFGSPYLGSSMIVNDRGAMIGNKSSGVEVNRLENALDLI